MADNHSPATGQFPQSDRKASISLVDPSAQEPTGSRDGPGTPTNNGGAVQPPPSQPAPATESAAPPPHVQEVLASDFGVPAMLNQLKASIASAKEFAVFLKKRSAVEETHASSLKKLSRTSNDVMHQPEHKTGTFARAYTEMMYVHERIAENGMQFALSLHQMHDDLIDLAGHAERHRKSWKTNGLAPEQRVAELESAMRKSKSKYDALADEYDRVRTGDNSRHSGKMFSLKTKSGPQHEEDLLRKVQAADQDYMAKVNHLQSERAELVARTRPEAVRALHELIKETDSGVALQMQKFASFNEKLLLSNGLTVSPIKGEAAQSSGPRSLREAVLSIDNARDLNDYLGSQHNKLPPNHGEVKYERNPVLNPQQPPIQTSQPSFQGQFPPPGQGPQSPQQFGPGSRTSTFNQQQPGQGQGFGPGPGQLPNPAMGGPQQQQQGAAASHNRSFSQGNMLNQGRPQEPGFGSEPNRNSAMPASRFSLGNSQGSSQGPPQLGALPFQNGPQQSPPLGQQPQGQQFQPQQQPPPPPQQQQQRQQGTNPLQQHPPSGLPQGPGPQGPGPQAAGRGAPYQGGRPSPPAAAQPTPSRPVFGLPLSKLYERDGLAVPMVVYQCIQAVDLFGLGLEGIYRQSGSVNHINKLKQMFDTDSTNPLLDFRNPENFYHDVNSVTGLLKQFLRDLPDPLLTMEQHTALIESAKHSDDIVRRDSLHAIINSLPDPNYATLRALTIHLHRVMDNSHVNRMNCHNLAVIFGPTLMGTDPSTSINDAGWQIKAVDTILQNTYQIFDDD